MRALDHYPVLREHFQSKGRAGVGNSTLANRLRKLHREEGVPNHLVDACEAPITQNTSRSVRGDIVSHHDLTNRNRELSILEFLGQVEQKMIESFFDPLSHKVQVILKCDLVAKDGCIDTQFFRFKQHILLESTNFEVVYRTIVKEEHTGRDSGPSLRCILGLDITLSKYDPLNLSSSSYILLPRKVTLTKGVLNMKNNDEECFKWATTRSLNPVERDGERVTKLLRGWIGPM